MDGLKNFSFIAFGRITNVSLQAIFYLLFATMLDPNKYGELGYYLALATTFATVSRFGLNTSIIVFEGKKQSNVVDQANILSVLTATIASIILLPINLYASLLCFGISFFIMNQHNLLAKQTYKKYFQISLLKGILSLSLTIVLYFIFDIPGILIGMFFANIILGFGFVRKISNKKIKFNEIRKNIKIILHNFGVNVSQALPRMLDKIIVAPLFGFATLGLYQFNFQILVGLEVLPISLYSFLLSEESSGKKVKKIASLVLGIVIILTIVVIISAPILIPILFPMYTEGIFELQILIISLIPLTVGSIFTAKLQSTQSTKIGYSGIVRISSLIVLIFFLGTEMQLMGLSLAVLISSTLSTGFVTILYTQEIRKR